MLHCIYLLLDFFANSPATYDFYRYIMSSGLLALSLQAYNFLLCTFLVYTENVCVLLMECLCENQINL